MDDALKQLLTLGRGYFEKKQYAQAEKFLAEVVEKNQSFADVYNMLGIVYHDQGQFARAQRAFEAALRINPGYTEAALNLAVIYNDMGKYREAKEVYQAALSRQRSAPNQIDPFVQGKIANMYADIGDVFVSSGMWPEAIEEFQTALQFGPQFVDLRLKLADAHRDSGDLPAAIKEYEEMFKINATYIPGRLHYGVALHSAGRKAEAIKTWEDVLSKSPGNKTAEMYLSMARDAGDKADKQG